MDLQLKHTRLKGILCCCCCLTLSLGMACDTSTPVATHLGSEATEASSESISAVVAGSIRIDVPASSTLEETLKLPTITLYQLPDIRPGFKSYAASVNDALESIDLQTLPPDFEVIGSTDSTTLIYQGDPTGVTFADFVLVLATSTLPPNLRTPANIAAQANTLFAAGNFSAEALDPVPTAANTDFVAGGSTPPPDLVDAALVYAATFLPPNLRTPQNLASTVNALLPGTNLSPDAIQAIPGIALPGGINLSPGVANRPAGSFQISVQVADLATPSFQIGAAQFVQLPPLFPGFTSYSAEPGSSLIAVEFSQVQIPNVTSTTCVIVHEPGSDPRLVSNQIATSEACDSVDLVGLNTQNQLVLIDSSASTAAFTVPVTGITGDLIGIDFRPANGLLYGLTTSNILYTINLVTGAATQASQLSVPFNGGNTSGFDFNPAADRLRLAGPDSQNFRINVDTGAVIEDGNLGFGPGPLMGTTPTITAVAYTNSFAGTTSTQLFDIDSNLDLLLLQDPPNDGGLVSIGNLGADFDGFSGFDILTVEGTNTGLAISGSTLYTIDLTTGVASPISTLNNGPFISLAAILR